MTTSNHPSNNKPDYSLTKQAQAVLIHLRLHFSMTNLEAKQYLAIHDLWQVVEELRSACHEIYEVDISRPEGVNSPATTAYSLHEWKPNLPEFIAKLTDLHLQHGFWPKETDQVREMHQAMLSQSIFFMKIDLFNRLGMKSRLANELQKTHPFVRTSTQNKIVTGTGFDSEVLS
jgi:hypothetical protein